MVKTISAQAAWKVYQEFWWYDLLPFKLPFSHAPMLFSATTLKQPVPVYSFPTSSNVADFTSLFNIYDKVVQ